MGLDLEAELNLSVRLDKLTTELLKFKEKPPSIRSAQGAALTVSRQRFVGKALGAVVGAIVASHFGPTCLLSVQACSFLGLLSAMARSDRSEYRFGGITLPIVLLVPRTAPPSQIAFHRCTGVYIGIGLALILAVVWPEMEVPPSGKT